MYSMCVNISLGVFHYNDGICQEYLEYLRHEMPCLVSFKLIHVEGLLLKIMI